MGNRRHGRNGFLYAAIASGGSAEPVFFINKWTFGGATDYVDVTAFGDTNKVNVSGLPDASLTFSGFWSDDGNDLYTASQDGVARKMYLYPDKTNKPNTYWYGSMFFDFSSSGGTGEAIAVSGTGKASGAISRNVA